MTMAGKSPQRPNRTRPAQRHAMHTPKFTDMQPFIHFFSVGVGVKNMGGLRGNNDSQQRSRWMDRENKQHVFPIETEKVSTLPYLESGTRHASVQWRSRCHCAVFFYFHARKAGDKTTAVGGSNGRVPGSQRHTHIHQNTSSVLQTKRRRGHVSLHTQNSVEGRSAYWIFQ